MKTLETSLSTSLENHLSAAAGSDLPHIANYLDEGSALMTEEAIASLHRLRVPLRTKIDGLAESERLRHRLEVLATFFEEVAGDRGIDPRVRRDVAFALVYFLKGFDRIPDTMPEIGLLDDAMIVDHVLQRHETTFRGHWLRRSRPWPEAL